MSRDYTPRPGSRSERAIEVLSDAPDGLGNVALARIVGCRPNNLGNHLRAAIRAGIVKWERAGTGHNVSRRWKLADPDTGRFSDPAPAGPTIPTHALDRWMIKAATQAGT